MNKILAADLIVSIHFVYVIIVVGGFIVIILGGVLKWRFVRNFYFRAIHLAMILIVVLETLFGITCPLTDLEYELRTAAGQQNITNSSFIARIIQKIMFYEFPPIVFIIVYCIFGAAVLISWWLIPPALPWKITNIPPKRYLTDN